MVEINLLLSPPLSESVKEIANKQFEGNLQAVLKALSQSQHSINE